MQPIERSRALRANGRPIFQYAAVRTQGDAVKGGNIHSAHLQLTTAIVEMPIKYVDQMRAVKFVSKRDRPIDSASRPSNIGGN
jgi:hypothetical protein